MPDGDARTSAAELFVVDPDRKPFGPYMIEKLRQYVAAGRILGGTLVHPLNLPSLTAAPEERPYVGRASEIRVALLPCDDAPGPWFDRC